MAHTATLEVLKEEFARGAIGIDTFEDRVATVLISGPKPARPASLLESLMARRRIAYIGRDPRCQLVLADDTVSRHHALLVRDGRRYELIDLESTNGTLVNGHPALRARVRAGDRITLGDSELVL